MLGVWSEMFRNAGKSIDRRRKYRPSEKVFDRRRPPNVWTTGEKIDRRRKKSATLKKYLPPARIKLNIFFHSPRVEANRNISHLAASPAGLTARGKSHCYHGARECWSGGP